MRIYPAVHYTMGGLWVDYNLMSNVPGLYVLGEANFSDHGANRLGASALMQGLADGYFVLPATIGDYLAPLLGTDARRHRRPRVRRGRGERRRPGAAGCSSVKGTRSVDHFHRELGKIMWDNCGMARSAESLEKALAEIPALREEFWTDVRVLGENETFNQSLEKAGRVADFLEFGELLVPRRPPPRGELRRPLPRRAPDRGGRGAARRRATSPTSPRGSGTGDGPAPEPPQGAARVRERPPRAAQLQVAGRRARGPDPQGLAPGRPRRPGRFETYEMRDVSADMSFLELLDVLNEQLIAEGEEPVAFDHDCREGICGSCAMMINGRAHGPETRHRHLPAPHAQVRRTAHDHRRAVAGRRVPGHQGPRGRPRAPSTASSRPAATSPRPPAARRDANLILVPKEVADAAMDAAACIGCGACVAACPNSAAQLFTAAKLSTSTCCPRASPSACTRVVGDGRGDGAVLRLVHEPRRVRGGVPEGDLDRLHRAA